ncbi:ATP-grasp domain-containing protein [Candidatus Saccharibacteria bacterium]|nr:ATP-grasp domain-containing protein [Candidatus Saccharibacteria bacterium]
MENKKLVVIGANDFQNQLILKAKELGFETHVFAWQDGSIGEKTADFFYPISIVEKDEILEKCKEIKPAGVCSIASDLASITVNYVAGGLGLTCNTPEDSEIRTNKYLMRQAMMDFGVKTPKFKKVSEGDEIDVSGMEFPMIVKPTDRSGSRGITKVLEESGLLAAVENATKYSFEKSAIIEEFIEGEEYSCECISYQGKHHFLAFTKKYTTGAPHFIETGHVEPSDIPEDRQEKIKEEIFKALDSLKIQNSASHTEFKIDNKGNFGIIEIGARMGGDCIGSDLVKLSTGKDFVKMVIEVATGEEPDLSVVSKPVRAEIKFIFTKEDLDELERVKQESPEKIYRISEMELDNMGKTEDSSSRVGYYILTSEKEER